jgi:DNA-binding GntR family transcriptional regulator
VSVKSGEFQKHFENAITRGQAVTEHKAVIEALSSRNPASAKKAMQRHLRSAHNRLTKQIEDDLQKTSKKPWEIGSGTKHFR